jgi:hypothetical protein
MTGTVVVTLARIAAAGDPSLEGMQRVAPPISPPLQRNLLGKPMSRSVPQWNRVPGGKGSIARWRSVSGASSEAARNPSWCPSIPNPGSHEAEVHCHADAAEQASRNAIGQQSGGFHGGIRGIVPRSTWPSSAWR